MSTSKRKEPPPAVAVFVIVALDGTERPGTREEAEELILSHVARLRRVGEVRYIHMIEEAPPEAEESKPADSPHGLFGEPFGVGMTREYFETGGIRSGLWCWTFKPIRRTSTEMSEIRDSSQRQTGAADPGAHC